MSCLSSALYLAGLFVFLNEWDLGRTTRPLETAAAIAASLLHSLQAGLTRLLGAATAWLLPLAPRGALGLALSAIGGVMLMGWTRTAWRLRETRQQLTAARRAADESQSDARDLRLRLDRASGSAAALEGLSHCELDSLESGAQKCVSPI